MTEHQYAEMRWGHVSGPTGLGGFLSERRCYPPSPEQVKLMKALMQLASSDGVTK